MFTTVGACPRCGAPIYSPAVWHAVVPPPSQHSCACFPDATVTTTTSTSFDPDRVKVATMKALEKLADKS